MNVRQLKAWLETCDDDALVVVEATPQRFDYDPIQLPIEIATVGRYSMYTNKFIDEGIAEDMYLSHYYFGDSKEEDIRQAVFLGSLSSQVDGDDLEWYEEGWDEFWGDNI